MTFPIIMGPPELSFHVRDVTIDPEMPRARASMDTRSWMCDTAGRIRAGTLGVLVDNLLGYSIIAGAPKGHWAVTTEMWIDVTGSLPPADTVVHGTGELTDRNASDGYAEALVMDSAGRALARTRQRGRFIPGLPQVRPCTSAPGLGSNSQGGPHLPVLLDQKPGLADGGLVASVDIESTVCNPNGNLHGGVAITWCEEAAAAALHRSGASHVTASVHAAYLRPAPTGTRLLVATRVAHIGRSTALVQVALTHEDGKPCVMATVSAQTNQENT